MSALRAPALILGLALDLALLPALAVAAPVPDDSAPDDAAEPDPRAMEPGAVPTAVAAPEPDPAQPRPAPDPAAETEPGASSPAPEDSPAATPTPRQPEGPTLDTSATPPPPDRGDWTGRTLTRAGIGMTVVGGALGIAAIGLAAGSATLENRLSSQAYDGKVVTDAGTFYAPDEAAKRDEIVKDGKVLNRATMIVAIPAVVILTTGIAMLATAQPWKRAANRRLRLRAGVGPGTGAVTLEGRF